uniref:Uncharacterized protein n=1 Tax=Takifugu rubripes TaxID=31033 RepID=A0A674MDH3_TAKRU
VQDLNEFLEPFILNDRKRLTIFNDHFSEHKRNHLAPPTTRLKLHLCHLIGCNALGSRTVDSRGPQVGGATPISCYKSGSKDSAGLFLLRIADTSSKSPTIPDLEHSECLLL